MLSGLSGLRGLAALIVVYYHLSQHRTTVWLSEMSWDIYQFTEHLVFVVSVFFILSGFFRSLSYWKKLEKDEPIPRFFSSLKDRFFRIAPSYYLALIVSLIVVWALGDITMSDIVRFFAGVLFLNWTSAELFFPVDHNWPLWFVTYDMLGWILVSFFMILVTRVWKKYFFPLFAVTCGILVIWHYGFVSLPWWYTEWVAGEWFPTYNPFLFWLHFMLGVLGGYLLTLGQRIITNTETIWADIGASASLLILSLFLWEIRDTSDWLYSWPYGPYHFPLVSLLVVMLVVCLPFTRYIGWIMDNQLFVFYSEISYTLYLFHALIIVLLRTYVFEWVQLDMDMWIYFSLVVFIISTAIAYVVTRWYEPIFLKR